MVRDQQCLSRIQDEGLRSRDRSDHRALVDRHGTPLAVSGTGGNRPDVTRLMPLLDAIPLVRGRRG